MRTMTPDQVQRRYVHLVTRDGRHAMRLERLRRYEDLIKRDGPDSIWVELREIDQEIEREAA